MNFLNCVQVWTKKEGKICLNNNNSKKESSLNGAKEACKKDSLCSGFYDICDTDEFVLCDGEMVEAERTCINGLKDMLYIKGKIQLYMSTFFNFISPIDRT